MRDHGVSARSSLERELKTLGYDKLAIDDLVMLRDHGLSAERIKRANDRAGSKLPVDALSGRPAGRQGRSVRTGRGDSRPAPRPTRCHATTATQRLTARRDGVRARSPSGPFLRTGFAKAHGMSKPIPWPRVLRTLKRGSVTPRCARARQSDPSRPRRPRRARHHADRRRQVAVLPAARAGLAGLTVVVSPLIALMKDQRQAERARRGGRQARTRR